MYNNLKSLDRFDAANKHYYAGANTYGTNFTYSSHGWSVKVFASAVERDAWVDDDRCPNGNPTRETIDRRTAFRICGISGKYTLPGIDRNGFLEAVYVG